MLSKKNGFWRILTTSLVLVSLSACGLYEGAPKEKVKDINSEKLRCLSDMKQKFVDYFDGRSTPSDLDQLYSCASSALDAYQEQTRGENAGRFTAQEVRNFLQTYFLKDFTITDGLLNELMLVKRGLLGGKTGDFTFADLQSAKDVFQVMKSIMLDLQPFMPLSFDTLKKGDAAQVDQASAALRTAISRFVAIIVDKKTVYAISDLDRLLNEIIQVFPEAKALEEFRGKLDLLSTLKVVLVSPKKSRDEVSSDEWKIILTEAARWAGVYLDYSHLDENYEDWSVADAKVRLAKIEKEGGQLVSYVIDRNGGQFTFKTMNEVLDAVLRAYPGSNSVIKVRSRTDLLSTLKTALIAPKGSRTSISSSEWDTIVKDGSEWATVYFDYRHLDKNFKDWTLGQGRAELSLVVGEAFRLFGNVIDRNSGTLTFATINTLLDQIPDLDGFLGTKISRKTLTKMIPPLIQRIFAGTDLTVTGRGAKGLTRPALDRILNVFYEWKESSRYLEGVYLKLSGAASVKDSLAFSIEKILSVPVTDAYQMSGRVTETGLRVAEDLRSALPAIPALLSGGNAGVLFDGKNATRPRSFKDVFQQTWIRPIFRQVLLGYLPPRANQKKMGLSLNEFTTFIGDFWPALVDLQYVGKRNSPERDGARRFREASLFTFASDGDDKISVDEGTQLVLFMISSQPKAVQVHAGVTALCRNGADDEFGKPTIDPECYRSVVFDFSSQSPLRHVWSSFPLMVQYFDSLSPTERELFATRFEKGIRIQGNTYETWFESGEADTLMMFIHYIEAVYQRYDTNPRSGTISYPESKAAFEVFKRELSGVAHYSVGSSKLESVFTWLLAKGESPIRENMSTWEKIKAGTAFYTWHAKGLMGQWDFECDRSNLYGVLGEISQGPSSTESLATVLDRNAPTGSASLLR